MLAKFKGNHAEITIIPVNVPTTTNSESKIDEFYNA
jgi:hypothetical protein